MKVLTINCVNENGSTGKIIKDISTTLSDRCDFVFCYEFGQRPKKNEYRIAGKYTYLFYYVVARLFGLKYSTGYTTTFRLIRYIKKQSPDIVHLHCPNAGTVNIPWLISFLKKNNFPTVITNHAEFYYTGNCPHSFKCMKFTTGCGNCSYVFDPYRKFLFDRTAYEWNKMKNAFNNFNKIIAVSVSPWVKGRQLLSPIMKDVSSVVIGNGIDTKKVFYHRTTNLREMLNINKEKKIVLHVTSCFSNRDDDLKGGHYILKLASKMPEVMFIVIGTTILDDNFIIPKNVLIQGRVEDQKLLAEYYSAANITVMTSRRETYGMSVSESLCCGTPVVGFEAGGPESIAIKEYTKFVPYGDVDALVGAISEYIELKNDELSQEISNVAKQKYDSSIMSEEYYKIYKKLTGNYDHS